MASAGCCVEHPVPGVEPDRLSGVGYRQAMVGLIPAAPSRSRGPGIPSACLVSISPAWMYRAIFSTLNTSNKCEKKVTIFILN